MNKKRVVGYLGCILAAREDYDPEEELRARGFRYRDASVAQEI